MDGIGGLRDRMRCAIQELHSHKEKNAIRLFHHNDCDGLTSAAVVSLALKHAGLGISERVALEKPYPCVLERILNARDGQVVIFADFCGRIADMISEINGGRNLVIILDHHVASVASDSQVFNCDCDLFGIKGDQDMTASIVCHTFAQELVGFEKAKDWSLLALLGAVGDGFLVNGKLHGFSKEVFEIAERASLASCEDGKYLNAKGEALLDVAQSLDTLGAVGYASGGSELAVRFLCESWKSVSLSDAPEDLVSELAKLEKMKKGIFDKALKHLVTERDTLFMDIGSLFEPMGVKMIGVFLTEICYEYRPELEDQYLIGFQNVPDELPGFGTIGFSKPMKKVSARVGRGLAESIRTGRALPLDVVLPRAAKAVGGFSDACHQICAAVVIEAEKIDDFLAEFVRLLDGGGIGVGYGHGKTILAGGDCGFLMWGVNGLVGALPYETVCVVEPGERDAVNDRGWIMKDKRSEVKNYKNKKLKVAEQAVDLVVCDLGLQELVKLSPIQITFRGSLLAASGDGASAAFCVSLARALNWAFKLGKDEEGINHAGWMGEHAFHGAPSGVDNTVSTYGGMIDISFDIETKKSKWERVSGPPVEIVLGHSGVTADTSSLLGICRNKREADSNLFDSQIERIKTDVAEMRRFFEAGAWNDLGGKMLDYQKIIVEMGLSHERVEELCRIGMAAGAVGAKITGGGLGGYCLFLTPGKDRQCAVRDAMEKAGAGAIMAVQWPST